MEIKAESKTESAVGRAASDPGAWNRRKLLSTIGGMALLTPLAALLSRVGGTSTSSGEEPALDLEVYGPLLPVRDETTGLALLLLPKRFRYISFGWTHDLLEDGSRTPPAHDGMAAFPAEASLVRLVRNHEVKRDSGVFAPAPAYDPAAGGGTTTLEFDTAKGRFLAGRASLAGTYLNCAGGPTPWGSWLTCEETVEERGRNGRLTQPHGFIFEVPAQGSARPVPLKSMGRFVHEAVAVDGTTGVVYETEDRSTAGLYRFLPSRPGFLEEGGRLQMLAVEGRPRFDTRRYSRPEEELPITWVDIADPERPHRSAAEADTLGVFSQGFAEGGPSSRAWKGPGKRTAVSTSPRPTEAARRKDRSGSSIRLALFSA